MQMHENFNVKALSSMMHEKMQLVTGEKITRLKFSGGGSYGRVFKAQTQNGNILALKAYRRKGMQNEEAAQLKILRENTHVPMPEVLFTHEDEDISLLAMSFIEGRNVLDPRYLLKSKTQKQSFAKEVVGGMLCWHEVKNEKFGKLESPDFNSWHDYYKAEKLEPLFSLIKERSENGKFKKETLDTLLKAYKIYEKIGDEPKEAVLIHGDLNIMNIMAKPKDLSLTGFIDPCGCMWASREYDLYQFRNMWGDKFGLYEEYKKNFPLSKESDFRVAFYAAINEFDCFFKSGETFALWQGVCMNMLKKEMKNFL